MGLFSKKHIKTDKTELNNQLIEKYGVNLESYMNPEIIEKIGSLLVFPKYVIKYVSMPIVILFLMYICSFFFLSFEAIGLIIYIILGLVLYLMVGVSLGLVYLISKIKSDVRSLIGFSFEISARALNDVSKIGNKFTKTPGAVGELFKGITLIVILPSIMEALANQIPLLGKLLNKLVQKSLIAISNKLKFSDTGIHESDHESDIKKKYVTAIENTQKKSDLIISKVFSLLQLPFKIYLFIYTFLLLGLISSTIS